jgi:hypothetical protein
VRTLYRLLLQLHPPAFRQRYAEEMLWIFDQTADGLETVRLLGDAVASLVRQRLLRSDADSSGMAPINAAPMFLVAAGVLPDGMLVK